MRSEGGQASVEWVGALLLIAIALGAIARLSDRVDAPGLATAGLRATTCAVAGCEVPQARVASTAGIDGRDSPVPRSRAVTLPPLLPPPPGGAPRGGTPGAPGGRTSGAPGGRTSGALGGGAAAPRRPSVRLTNPIPPRMRARFGTLWRRAWVACFAYERVRYGLLHPENHRQVVPLRDVAQMTNDCLSPFDFARDWEHLQP